MKRTLVHQKVHGYRKGHQSLSSSVSLSPRDEDTVDRLSDMAGPLRPGEVFDPYLTAYPLPSGTYYVVGRTFQDLTAVRSGCVVTRSLLIPMNDWAELDSLEGLLSILLAPDPEEEAKECEVALSGAPPTSTWEPGVLELVEALFFEERQPVVYFDAVEAEAIALRLFVSLWPGLRRKFSICTYTLGPRRIGERYFDLVFAPATARPRFLDVPLRRIGVSVSGVKEPKSRWAQAMALDIFRSDVPSLVAKDALGVLANDEDGDPTSIRLMLLWNDLASRASDTPTAVLGMLDVLNARDSDDRVVWNDLLSTIIHAVELAGNRLSTQEAWRFLFSLEIKTSRRKRQSTTLLRHIESAARHLAHSDVSEALRHLESETQEKIDPPPHALKGLADGVAESEVFPGVFERLDGIPAIVVLRMLEGSEAFLRCSVDALTVEPGKWNGLFAQLLNEPNPGLLAGVRRELVRRADEELVGRWLPFLLDGVSGRELVELAVDVATRKDFATGVIDQAIVGAAKVSGSVDLVRDAVARQIAGERADRFLLATLDCARADLEWLVDRLEDPERARRLLVEVLNRASDKRIREISAAKGVLGAVLNLLARNKRSGARQIARVLMLDAVTGEEGVDAAFGVLPGLPQGERDELGIWMLRQALGSACMDDHRVADILSRFGEKMQVGDLVNCVAGGKGVGRNIALLNSGPRSVRRAVVTHVDVLSTLLVKRTQEDLGQAAYAAWAAMIKDSEIEGHEIRYRAARTVLSFALRRVRYPVSSLVVAAFPAVYEESVTGRLSTNDDVASDWGTFASRLWPSSKRSKSRLRELLARLVDAYMKSSWPPADLLLIAMQVGVEEKVLKRIRRKPSGTAYLANIRRDVNRFEETLRGQMLKHLSQDG